MLLRVVPEEGQNVLPEDSTPWAKELPSSTWHSNRALRPEVPVAEKWNFQRGDKEAETTLEIQGRRCRDKITLGNSANSGLIARSGESALERECVVADAVAVEPVSARRFPANRGKNREFYKF
jgi:hypothetical protein